MLDEAAILQTVDDIYRARVGADRATLASYLAPHSTYELNGDRTLLAAIPTGPADAAKTIDDLVATFRFHSAERRDAIVCGNRAAIVMRVDVSAGEGNPVPTEFVDMWEFDDSGRVKSLRQFIDTALAASLVA